MAADAEAADISDGWTRRRARIAGHIERTALALFAAHGSQRVTVEQIATAAGVSERTFFRYFSSRRDVLTAFPRRNNVDIARCIAARPPTESILEAFLAGAQEALIVADRELSGEGQELARLWGMAIGPTVEAARTHDDWTIPTYMPVIAARLGLPPTDIRVEITTTAITGAMWVGFGRWINSEGGRRLTDFLAEAFHVLGDLDRPSVAPASSAKSPKQWAASRGPVPKPRREASRPRRAPHDNDNDVAAVDAPTPQGQASARRTAAP
jgi:AcrR family transcriptional regulator